MARKSMRPGGGGRFQKMVEGMTGKGMSEERARGIAAAAGRRKYGKKRFQKMAARGARRARR
jgi:hypothetical protein